MGCYIGSAVGTTGNSSSEGLVSALRKSAGISMMVPMPYGLSMGKRLKPTTKLGFKAWQQIWMESLHLCVYHLFFSDLIQFTDAYSHRLVCFLLFSLPSSSKVFRTFATRFNLRITAQSAYYQQQSVAMLAQISQQLASIAPQVSHRHPLHPPSLYTQQFHPIDFSTPIRHSNIIF